MADPVIIPPTSSHAEPAAPAPLSMGSGRAAIDNASSQEGFRAILQPAPAAESEGPIHSQADAALASVRPTDMALATASATPNRVTELSRRLQLVQASPPPSSVQQLAHRLQVVQQAQSGRTPRPGMSMREAQEEHTHTYPHQDSSMAEAGASLHSPHNGHSDAAQTILMANESMLKARGNAAGDVDDVPHIMGVDAQRGQIMMNSASSAAAEHDGASGSMPAPVQDLDMSTGDDDDEAAADSPDRHWMDIEEAEREYQGLSPVMAARLLVASNRTRVAARWLPALGRGIFAPHHRPSQAHLIRSTPHTAPDAIIDEHNMDTSHGLLGMTQHVPGLLSEAPLHEDHQPIAADDRDSNMSHGKGYADAKMAEHSSQTQPAPQGQTSHNAGSASEQSTPEEHVAEQRRRPGSGRRFNDLFPDLPHEDMRQREIPAGGASETGTIVSADQMPSPLMGTADSPGSKRRKAGDRGRVAVKTSRVKQARVQQVAPKNAKHRDEVVLQDLSDEPPTPRLSDFIDPRVRLFAALCTRQA